MHPRLRRASTLFALASPLFASSGTRVVAQVDDRPPLTRIGLDSLVEAQHDARSEVVRNWLTAELIEIDRLASGRPPLDTSGAVGRLLDLFVGPRNAGNAEIRDKLQRDIVQAPPSLITLALEIARRQGDSLVPTSAEIEAKAREISRMEGARAVTAKYRAQARLDLCDDRFSEAARTLPRNLAVGHRVTVDPELRPSFLPPGSLKAAKTLGTLMVVHHQETDRWTRDLDSLGWDGDDTVCAVRFVSTGVSGFEAEVRCPGDSPWRIDQDLEPFPASLAGPKVAARFGKSSTLRGLLSLETETSSALDSEVTILVLRTVGRVQAAPSGRCGDSAVAHRVELHPSAAERKRLEALDGTLVTVSGTLDCRRGDEAMATPAQGAPAPEAEDMLELNLRGAQLVP